MTSKLETVKLSALWIYCRFIIVALVAFGITWYGFNFQESYFRKKQLNRAASRITKSDKLLLPDTFKGWDENYCHVVAENVIKEGIPVPLKGKVVYQLHKSGIWGNGYQGFIESSFSREHVQNFYLKNLPKAGWRSDSMFAKSINTRKLNFGLRFTRGPATLMIIFFSNQKNNLSTDFRLSITCRK